MLKCIVCATLLKNKQRKFCSSRCKNHNTKPSLKICFKCGKLKKVQRKNDGKPLCISCCNYKNSSHVCSICGELREVNSVKIEPICKKCYQKNYIPHKKECITCGNIRTTHSNNECKKCYRSTYKSPKRKCITCGKIKENCNLSSKKCLNCHNKERIKNDEQFLIRTRIRKRISRVFIQRGISSKYPINYNKIAEHLGPCPGQRNEYHIDHIFPLIAFDLTDVVQLIAALAPENHQWLTKSENCSKKDTYDKCMFMKYLEKFKNI